MRLLYIPPAVEPKRYLSVRRVEDATLRALQRAFSVISLEPHPVGQTSDFVARFRDIRSEVDVVFDMTGLAVTGPVAPDVPVISWALGNLPHGASRLSGRRRFLKSTDTLLVNCTADREILDRTLTTGGLRSCVVPFGVDTGIFQPIESPQQRAKSRTSLGLPTDAFLVVFSGRVNLQKNVHLLLDLAARCRAEIPTIHLAVAGQPERTPMTRFGVTNDDYPSYLATMAEHLGLERTVSWLGQLDDRRLSELLGCSDAFVSLSTHHDENFGFAPVEAMAAGVPSIVTDWGGYRDSVIHGITGYRVPTYLTSQGLQVAWPRAVVHLVQLARDPIRRGEMRHAARRHAQRNYSQETFESSLVAAVRATASLRGQPGAYGSNRFRFHPLALEHQALNALDQLARERTGARTLDRRLDARSMRSYRFFIRPYATVDVSDITAVASDRPTLLDRLEPTARDRGWRSHNLIWPTEHEIPHRYAEAIRGLDGRADVSAVAYRGGLDPVQLTDILTQMARQGVVDLGRPWATRPPSRRTLVSAGSEQSRLRE